METTILYIPAKIYSEILSYVNGCDIEISGMGQLKPHKGGYIVTRVHLPKQTCTGVTTEMNDMSLGKIEYECEAGKYADDGDLLWWWHSHVDMQTFWSGVDMSTIDSFGREGARIVATVFNTKREMRTAYRQGPSRDGLYPSCFMDDLKTVIVPDQDQLDMIAQCVSEPVYKTQVCTPKTPSLWEQTSKRAATTDLEVYTNDMCTLVAETMNMKKSDVEDYLIEYEYEYDIELDDKVEAEDLMIYIKQKELGHSQLQEDIRWMN